MPFVPVYQPVDQDRFYDDAKGLRGNCLQAVVASLTGVDLDCVPHFVQIDHDGGGYWEDQMNAWLAERGLRAKWWLPNTSPEDWPDPPFNGYTAVYGPSPRGGGISHIVISHRGRIVHDPHPDRTGIEATNGAWWLVPSEPSQTSTEVDGTPDEKASHTDAPERSDG